MLLHLQKYDFKLNYTCKSGKEMQIAGTLSRACIKDTIRMEEELSCAVNLVLNNSSVSDVWLQETTTKDQNTGGGGGGGGEHYRCPKKFRNTRTFVISCQKLMESC